MITQVGSFFKISVEIIVFNYYYDHVVTYTTICLFN